MSDDSGNTSTLLSLFFRISEGVGCGTGGTRNRNEQRAKAARAGDKEGCACRARDYNHTIHTLFVVHPPS